MAPNVRAQIDSQRLEATRAASYASGLSLDPVEADRWWGRWALRERMKDPVGTAGLSLWRLALVVSYRELALGAFPPSLDENPLRWARAPLWLIVGLAAAGVWLRGWRGTGGWLVWGTALACLATPLIFYVSSRYRLPVVAVLCLPAGAGVSSLVGSSVANLRGRRVGFAVLGCGILVSLLVPSQELHARLEAVGLVQRAQVRLDKSDPRGAETDLRRALEIDADSGFALVYLARLFENEERIHEAETLYRRALLAHPHYADAAGNLGRLLNRSGRADEAIPFLEKALYYSPIHRGYWTSLVVTLTGMQEFDAALDAAQEAATRGVELAPGLVSEVQHLQSEALRRRSKPKGQENP